MKRKNKEEDLTVAETGWGMLDNLGDKIVEDTVTGVASDFITAIPMGNVLVGIYKGVRRANNERKYKNFISFVRSYKTNTDKEIHKYLKDNPTSQLGDYTLNMIEDLSYIHQTEMLGRATALLLNGIISEEQHYEYGYIITKLDPHLFKLVTALREKYILDERGREDLNKKWQLVKDKKSTYVQNPNQDLLSFGFLDAQEIEMNAGMEKLPERKYAVNIKYKKFYDRIIIGEKCTK